MATPLESFFEETEQIGRVLKWLDLPVRVLNADNALREFNSYCYHYEVLPWDRTVEGNTWHIKPKHGGTALELFIKIEPESTLPNTTNQDWISNGSGLEVDVLALRNDVKLIGLSPQDTLAEIRDDFANRIMESGADVTIVGQKISSRTVVSVGPIILLILMIGYSLHLRHTDKLLRGAVGTQLGFPWIVLFQNRLARYATAFVSVLLPPLSVAIVLWRLGDPATLQFLSSILCGIAIIFFATQISKSEHHIRDSVIDS